MELIDFKGNKQETMTRLAICVVAALIIWSACDKLGDKVKYPLVEQYLPWLRENKVQAIAILAAVFFGLSLALWPVEKEKLPEPDPCEGYEPV